MHNNPKEGIEQYGMIHLCTLNKTNDMTRLTRTTTRMVLYTKDIIIITGKSDRTARRMMAAIKKKYHKNKNALVSVDDFCSYTGLREEKVREVLQH